MNKNNNNDLSNDKIISFDILLDILARGESNYKSPDALRWDIIKFDLMKLIKKFTIVSVPKNINKDNFQTKEKYIDIDGLYNFLVRLCKTLNIDEETALYIWELYYNEHYYFKNIRKEHESIESIESKVKADYNSFELLEKVRNFYLEQRSHFWKCIHELLRILRDQSHIYYNEAGIVLDPLLKNKELLESFNIWFKNWKGISREISIEEPDFKNFIKHSTLMEFFQFKARITTEWTQQVYYELEDILTTLILIQENKPDYLNAFTFNDLLQLDLEGSLSSNVHINEKTLNNIKAKYIILYARILNLDEIKMSLEEMEDENDVEMHKFFRLKPNETPENRKKSLDGINFKMMKLREDVTRTVNQNRKDFRVEMSGICILLWALFLEAPRFNPDEKKIVEDCKGDHITFLVDDGRINYYVLASLIDIVSYVLENAELEYNLIRDICPTLSYIQAHIIISMCNEKNDFIGHELVIKLVSETFAKCKELCEHFWNTCEYNPLYTIIINKFLSHPDKPELLFETLQPLICSTASANEHIVSILNTPIIDNDGNNYANWWDVLLSSFQIPLLINTHIDDIYPVFERLSTSIKMVANLISYNTSFFTEKLKTQIQESHYFLDLFQILYNMFVSGEYNKHAILKVLIDLIELLKVFASLKDDSSAFDDIFTQAFFSTGRNSFLDMITRLDAMEEEYGTCQIYNGVCNLFYTLFKHIEDHKRCSILFKLFQDADTNCQGYVSSYEFYGKLNATIPTITFPEVDSFLKNIEEKYQISRVSYGDILRYLSSIDIDNINDFEVKLLDLIYDGGMTKKLNSEAIVKSCLMYCINIYCRLDKRKFHRKEDKWNLAITCSKIFDTVVDSHQKASISVPYYNQIMYSSVAASPIAKAGLHFIQYCNQEKNFLKLLYQSALSPGLSALQSKSNSETYPTTHKGLKSFLESSEKSLTATFQTAVLPIDFSLGVTYSSIDEQEIILSLCNISLLLIDKVLEVSAALSSPTLFKSLSIFFETAECYSGTIGASNKGLMHLECTYLAVLAGMMRITMIFLRMIDELQYNVAKLLAKVILFKSKYIHDQKSLVDIIGLANIPGMVQTICDMVTENTNSKINRITSSMNKVALLDLLLTISNVEPISLALFLGVHKNDSALTVNTDTHSPPKTSAIIAMIEYLLIKTPEFYDRNSNSIYLIKVFRFILSLWKNADHGTTCRASLYLLEIDKFWEYVTYPLMQRIDIDSENATTEQCINYRNNLLAHAASLELITYERLGIIFSMDKVKAEEESRKISKLYRKWVNVVGVMGSENIVQESGLSYMNVVMSDRTICEMNVKFSKFFYVDLLSLFIDSGCHQYLNEGFAELTLSQKFATLISGHQWKSTPLFEMINNDDHIKVSNCINMFCIGDAQMKVLQCWRNFLELYVPLGTSLNARSQHLPIPKTTQVGNSPLIGSLSPNVNHAPDSPGARPTSVSLFDGDKRSYELIRLIMKQFGQIIETNIFSGSEMNQFSNFDVFSACVVAEKCQILVSMLHHQLRTVILRAPNPEKSQVEIRDANKTSITLKKVFEYVKILISLYKKLVLNSNTELHSFYNEADGDMINYKSLIKMRLLTAQLLLLRSASVTNSVIPREYKSEHDAVFHFAFEIFYLEIQNYTNDNKSRVEPSLALAQVCVNLIKAAMPVDDYFNTENWGIPVSYSSLSKSFLLVQTVQYLSKCVKDLPLTRHDYRLWQVKNVVGMDGDIVTVPCTSSTLSDEKYHNHDSNQNQMDVATKVLGDVFDVILMAIANDNLFLNETGDIFIETLTSLPLFENYQYILSTHNETFCSSLMAYETLTGEPSNIFLCWKRVIDILSLIVERVFGSNNFDHLQAKVFNDIAIFIAKYELLLVLPLNCGQSRYTLRQLMLLQSTITFFHKLCKYISPWKSMVPTLYKKIYQPDGFLLHIAYISQILAAASTKKNVNQDKSNHDNRICLSTYCLAVAEDERYGLKYSKKKAKPQQSLTISPLLKQQTNDTFENTTNVNDDKELEIFYMKMKTMMVQSLLPIIALALIVEKDVSENQINLESGMTMVYYCGDPKGDDDGPRRSKSQYYLMEGLIDEMHDDDTISVIDREGRRGIIDVSAFMYIHPPKIDFMPTPFVPDTSGGRESRTSSLLNENIGCFDNTISDKVRCTTAHLHVFLNYLNSVKNSNNIEMLTGLTCELYMKSMMHHLVFYYKSNQFKHHERNINKEIQIHNSLKSEDLRKQFDSFHKIVLDTTYNSHKWKNYKEAFDLKYTDLNDKLFYNPNDFVIAYQRANNDRKPSAQEIIDHAQDYIIDGCYGKIALDHFIETYESTTVKISRKKTRKQYLFSSTENL